MSDVQVSGPAVEDQAEELFAGVAAEDFDAFLTIPTYETLP